MSISTFLVEYMLKRVFDGKKLRYAKFIQVNEANVRKVVADAEKGKGHAKFMEQTIEMCVKYGIDVSPILQGYSGSITGALEQKPICAYGYIMIRIKAFIAVLATSSFLFDEQRRMLKNASEMHEIIEKHYCGQNDRSKAACSFFREAGKDQDLDENAIMGSPCKSLDMTIESIKSMFNEV